MTIFASARTSSPIPEFHCISFSEILGEHPAVLTVQRDKSLPPPAYPCPEFISPAGLLRLAAQYPLDVVVTKNGYECIGNVRLFKWLKSCPDPLPPDAQIAVRVFSGLKPKALAEHIFIDLLVAPALWGMRAQDVRPMGIIWERLKHEDPFAAILTKPGKQGLAALIGVDSRRFRRRNGQKSPRVD